MIRRVVRLGNRLPRFPYLRAHLVAGATALAALAAAGGIPPPTPRIGATRSPSTRHRRSRSARASPCSHRGIHLLQTGHGYRCVVREGLGAKAKDGRADRRRSLAYFAQISDFQLSDEESPRASRTSTTSPRASPSACRPQKACSPRRSTGRQSTRPSAADPPGGRHPRPELNAVLTDTSRTASKRNETHWSVQLLEGGVYPNGKRIGDAQPEQRHEGSPWSGLPGTPARHREPALLRRRSGLPRLPRRPVRLEFHDANRPTPTTRASGPATAAS